MNWKFNREQPQLVECKISLGQRQYTINYIIEQAKDEDEQECWRYTSTILPPGIWNYGAIVNAIVTAEYPADRMQAVVNNYLLDPSDPSSLAEMNELQAWRTFAKSIAHQALTEIPPA